MDFPQIRLTSQPAKININVNRGKQFIQQPKADVQIEQPKAEQDIRQVPPQLTIDQTKAWENLDLKGILARVREHAEHSNSDWFQDLAIASQQGDQLMKIEDGGNPIAQQGKENSIINFDLELGTTPVYDLVDIVYEPARAEITTRKSDPVINIKANKPKLDYQHATVDISMQQYAKLDVDFEGLKYKGYRFETNI